MFSVKEKQWLASEIEKLLLSLNHPEMPEEKPHFEIKIQGKYTWSFAYIIPNWLLEPGHIKPNIWNEVSRDVLSNAEALNLNNKIISQNALCQRFFKQEDMPIGSLAGPLPLSVKLEDGWEFQKNISIKVGDEEWFYIVRIK